MNTPATPGFRHPFTGVIFVMAEAARHAYRPGQPRLAQHGTGQPETGPLPGAPPRVSAAPGRIRWIQEYAPLPGPQPLGRGRGALQSAEPPRVKTE